MEIKRKEDYILPGVMQWPSMCRRTCRKHLSGISLWFVS